MPKLTNNIKGITNTVRGYNSIANFYANHINHEFSNIYVRIDGFIAANMASPLGVILDLLKNNLNAINLDVSNEDAKTVLQKNQFLLDYGYDEVDDSNNTTLPYRRYKLTENIAFIEYVNKRLLGKKEMPSLSLALRNEILKVIGEIFANASMHSESDYVYVCGQFFPNKHLLYLTISDAGMGIKNTVNNAEKASYSAIDAIKWALVDGNTTKTNAPGGYGLDILKKLISKNKGTLQIISDDGFYELNENGETEYQLENEFPGTVVSLQFRTDDKSSYSLKEENI